MQRDALAALARQVERSAADDLLLVNPLPFERTITGDVANWVLSPRGTTDDSTAGRHFQDRHSHTRRTFAAGMSVVGADLQAERTALPPTIVPAFGYVVVPRRNLVAYTLGDAASEDAVVENDHHRLHFDTGARRYHWPGRTRR